ncbi:hypothetical protein D9M68_959140 [compost metagenome]
MPFFDLRADASPLPMFLVSSAACLSACARSCLCLAALLPVPREPLEKPMSSTCLASIGWPASSASSAMSWYSSAAILVVATFCRRYTSSAKRLE